MCSKSKDHGLDQEQESMITQQTAGKDNAPVHFTTEQEAKNCEEIKEIYYIQEQQNEGRESSPNQ